MCGSRSRSVPSLSVVVGRATLTLQRETTCSSLSSPCLTRTSDDSWTMCGSSVCMKASKLSRLWRTQP